MHLNHSAEVWASHPELVAGVLHVKGISSEVSVSSRVAALWDQARARLASSQEGDFTEIKAWRRVFGKMGLKPTQYRCASESLLRRFRKEGSLPGLHPLVDLCNALSLASAIPIAVFDLDHVDQFLEVRHASGTENYLDFSGETEHPEPREIIFADHAGNAHARRWANRQSALSAIRSGTRNVLIVIEAHHERAADDVARLMTDLSGHLEELWPCEPLQAVLRADAPRFDFQPG